MDWNRDDAVAAYVDALEGVLAVAETLEPHEWSLPTDLPGWSVQDNVSHVVAVEHELAGRPAPDHEPDYEALSHVTNDFARHMEIGVDARRHLPPADLLDELREIVTERVAVINGFPDDPSYEVPGPMGTTRTLERSLPIRAFDIWAHEQDVRRAVDRPERLTGPAAAASMERIVAALPMVLGKEAGLPDGTGIRFVIEPPGPAPAGLTVLVAVDTDGQGRLVDDESATADVILTMPFEAFAKAATGRRRPGSGQLSVIGDASLVDRILDALVITP